jgi:hypothetical protein
MYTIQSDEKTTPVMLYGRDKLIRAEVITKSGIMVSRWLRTPAAPAYLHVLKANVLSFGSGTPRVNNFEEMFFPTNECLVFHLTPPNSDPLDYDADEHNRLMLPISLLVGSFLMQGKVRISAQIDLSTTLEGMRNPWLSFYEITITNPSLPQMRVELPMALINAAQVTFGLG